jgi:enoyl-CoA hydratase
MTEIVIEERGRLIIATFNRPEKLHAITLEMLEGLMAATHTLRQRDDLQVLLVRATGKYFSAG